MQKTLRLHVELALLTAATVVIHGYHPSAEDGGLYSAGVKLFLQPSLFPHDAAFVSAHRGLSLFDPILGGVTLILHVPLPWTLFLAHLICLHLTLLSLALLAGTTSRNRYAPIYAAGLGAAVMTLPIAGTSLFFMEPYLTARSFSTPLSLLAVGCFLRTARMNGVSRRNIAAVLVFGCLLAAAAMHIAMSAQAGLLICLLAVSRIVAPTRRRFVTIALLAGLLVIGAAFQFLTPSESSAAVLAARTRSYWFLSEWQWYEWLGLAAPLGILRLAMAPRARSRAAEADELGRAAILLGVFATTVALFFAHHGFVRFPIARLQPLRAFLLVYAVLLVQLGSWIASFAHPFAMEDKAQLGTAIAAPAHSSLSRRPVAAATALAVIATAMFCVQRLTFPASRHLELPGRPITNPWEQAFLWARDHTAPAALFALDSDYIHLASEDAETFRDITERSMLSDYPKDGGLASVRPALAPQWLQGYIATVGLNALSPAERRGRLLPLHVEWMILPSAARTPQPCPFDNGTAKVCPLQAVP